MSKPFYRQSGITLLETLVVLTIFCVVAAIAYPNINAVRNQMRSSEDAKGIALAIEELRAEAIRLRQPVRFNFTSNGVKWDIYNDGTYEGSYTFNQNVTWDGTPNDFTINGFGLIRGLPNNVQTFSIVGGTLSRKITINGNGHVEVS